MLIPFISFKIKFENLKHENWCLEFKYNQLKEKFDKWISPNVNYDIKKDDLPKE